jgi:hypothetical protein
MTNICYKIAFPKLMSVREPRNPEPLNFVPRFTFRRELRHHLTHSAGEFESVTTEAGGDGDVLIIRM